MDTGLKKFQLINIINNDFTGLRLVLRRYSSGTMLEYDDDSFDINEVEDAIKEGDEADHHMEDWVSCSYI